MGAFNFRNKLELNVEGNKFIVDTASSKLAKAQLDLVNGSLEIAKSNNTDQEMSVEQILKSADNLKNVAVDYIKAVIGENGFDLVFHDKEVEYADVVDLATYICEEITKFKENKLEAFSKKGMS